MIGKLIEQRVKRLLCWISAALILVANVAGATANTVNDTQEPYFYTLTITGENVFADVHINGAPLYFHGQMEPLLTTLTVAGALLPGTNTITLNYEPFDLERQSFTPHDGVLLQVKLERRTMLDSTNPEENSIHLFSGRYDSALGEMVVSSDDSVFGQGPLRRQDGGLRQEDVKLRETVMQYGNRTSDGHAMQITMDVSIMDPLLNPPPWADASALTDTPELRARLAQRYRTLHDIVARNDEQAWRHEMRFVYGHMSWFLGYRDAEQMADDVRSKIPLGPPEGSALAPLGADIAGGLLKFGADRRLVKVSRDPVGFETPVGERVGEYGFTFCEFEGRLEICFMQDIPN